MSADDDDFQVGASGDGGWSPDIDTAADVVEYYQGRPVEFYQDMGFELADAQKAILRACQDHNRIIVQSGNGTGKTAGVMMAEYHYFITNWNSVNLTTSGNFPVLKDTAAPFLETIHQRAKDTFPLPGEFKQSPPRIDMESWPEWFLRFRSPRDPRNLEGRHGRRAFVVIDEADKPDVTSGHFDAATSTASSDEDVVVAIANPPQDSGDIVERKLDDDRWKNIEFSSFDSHNVMRDLGELADDDQRGGIPGLVDLDLVIEDYEAWNGMGWPGADEARNAVIREDGRRVARDDWRSLDPRWYRKRLGVRPPADSGTLRPWYEHHVDQAVDRWKDVTGDGSMPSRAKGSKVVQLGGDVARDGGDRTVLVARWDTGLLDVLLETRVQDHPENEDLFITNDQAIDRSGLFVIDAIGEGSGVADHVKLNRNLVRRFKASEVESRDEQPGEDLRYRNRATEAAVDLGNLLKTGQVMVPPNSSLENELREAARAFRLKEQSYRGNDVYRLKGKDDLKDPSRLGRSPDIADAAMLAAYDGFEGDADPSAFDIGGVVG